jgi:hypothetical protein
MTDRLTRYHHRAVWTAELTLLLLALLLSSLTDAAVWAAPRLGRLAGRAYRLGRRHWPTVRRAAEAVRVTAARFVWAQAGYSPAPVQPRPVVVAAVVARALPSLLPSLTRRQLLRVARAVRLPGYSRLSTDQLRAFLCAG